MEGSSESEDQGRYEVNRRTREQGRSLVRGCKQGEERRGLNKGAPEPRCTPASDTCSKIFHEQTRSPGGGGGAREVAGSTAIGRAPFRPPPPLGGRGDPAPLSLSRRSRPRPRASQACGALVPLAVPLPGRARSAGSCGPRRGTEAPRGSRQCLLERFPRRAAGEGMSAGCPCLESSGGSGEAAGSRAQATARGGAGGQRAGR